MLKKNDQWGSRLFYGGMVALMLAAFMWFARNNLVGSLPFLAIAVTYAVLVVRVAAHSFRAFTAMLWTFQLNFWTLISIDVEGVLDIPAAGPGSSGSSSAVQPARPYGPVRVPGQH
ncbi:hypothetical protein [Pseudarthrobacter sp. NS4]|uniref:hypothetical protein n=1 Tax=Pseudarthrobacter sp. NS4 TaxID=2973976 RepID=UPI0021635E1C|nr:hypothetical protein [Pseudarthrobacter sp. NS4]